MGLAWSGDLRVVPAQRTGDAAEVSPAAATSPVTAAPTAVAAATAIAAPAAPVAPTWNTAPIAQPMSGRASELGAQATSAVASAPGVGSAPGSQLIVNSVSGADANPERRRGQTWVPPVDPALLDGYVWPLPKARITNPFGPSPWGSHVVDGRSFHDGIDIATFCGDHIVAAHAGVVLAAGRQFDDQIGWVGDLAAYKARLDAKHLWWTLPITVVIDDGNGYRSIYAHFYQVVVKPGERVTAGQFLGYEGATGRASGCHLHYGLFAPHETATMALEPKAVKDLLVPPAQIARIDPLLVLPRRPGDNTLQPTTSSGTGHDLGT